MSSSTLENGSSPEPPVYAGPRKETDDAQSGSREQIIGVLKEHQAGLPVAEICRRHGISDATFYTWRAKYGGLEVSDAKRLKALEEENRKLKKLLAEQMLDAATLREMLGKTLAQLPEEGRDLGHPAKSYSQRRPAADRPRARAATVPSSRRPGCAEAARACPGAPPLRLSAPAHPAPRGLTLNHKRLFRLYCEERLMVRKRAAGSERSARGHR